MATWPIGDTIGGTNRPCVYLAIGLSIAKYGRYLERRYALR
jgi:hypothetical protein